MAETMTAANYEITETPQELKKKKAARRRRKKVFKTIIILLIIAALCAAAYLGLKKIFAENESSRQALTDFTYRGTITTRINGGGVTSPVSSEDVLSDFKCKIENVLVSAGTVVSEGTPLYTINTDEVALELEAANKVLQGYEKDYEEALRQPDEMREQIAALQQKIASLTVTAPFAGKVMDVSTAVGSFVPEGSVICTLVDDSKMLLTLYFSYAYAGAIKVGDAAAVSIPSTMSNLDGNVKEVTMVERISPEGTKLFEVVIEVKNGGTLTEGVLASASVKLADGSLATPYEAAALKYCNVKNITAQAGGEVVSGVLKNYSVVKNGAALLRLKNDEYEKQIAALEKSIEQVLLNAETYVEKIDAQQQTIAQLQEKMENNIVCSSINGMVSSVMIIADQNVDKGIKLMTISDSSVMTISARIDSLNIGDVSVGSEVMLTQWGMDYDINYVGVIADISLEGQYENNYSYFPAIIRVDNPDGTMLSGTYVDYEIIANEAVDCIIAPAQCVKSTDAGTIVFVKSDFAPENVVELGEGIEIPEGFWPVAVKTGLSDNYSVEIVEGLDEGAELFLQYMTDSGSSWENGLF